ncbi:MAG TPA: polysaccharide pyruvyl transferase family protein [Acidimicrobiales bacterium]|nr:polysaccharide pyruvyl transferase family protein [Acidimicrobiales bacterium]
MPETRVAILGAAFSANRGAASMLQAVIDNLPDRLGPCRFSVLTTYPADDRVEAGEVPSVTVVSARPVELALLLWPLALLAAGLRRVRLPWRWLCRPPALRHLRDADVVVDVAGISFADGRGAPIVIYNALMTSLPLLLGRPTVKASQAMGPFRSRLNRTLARLVLPRLRAVCARGAATERHLAELGLTNVEPAADLAFTMHMPADAVVTNARPTVGLAPSAVVKGYCDRAGVDYVALFAGLADRILDSGRDVVVFPHSSRRRVTGGRMDDRPVTRAVHERCPRARLVDDPLGPVALRGLIAGFDLLVTSRFHAMISALATTTPVLVVGWSHKYDEVLAEIGVEGCAVDWSATGADSLAARAVALLDDAPAVRATIERALPAVTARSARNYEVIASAARKGGTACT